MLIYDEDNRPWFTAPGDPADAMAKALTRAGFRKIVLPAETIRTGQVPEPNFRALEALAACVVEPDIVGYDAVRDLFIRRSVMTECCVVAKSLVGLTKEEEADGREEGEGEGEALHRQGTDSAGEASP